ncbi:hypothetical protein EBU95_03720 [bacterium]|nr:hypothetical protein [bacterium]
MKYLLIGDLHVKPDNIEESQKFIDWICEVIKKENVVPIFMGDQYDTHGNIRVEILDFWQKAYDKIGFSISIVGNHDMDYSCEFTSLSSNLKQTQVIKEVINITYDTVAVPYIKSSKKFVDTINSLSDKIKYVLCHQEFFGAQYEGGFYAPNGVKLEEINKDVIFISGHIHKKQILKDKEKNVKVFYVGTPRQLTRSDIDEVKGVHLWNGNDKFEFLETPEEVCQKFKKIILTQENDNYDVKKINSKTFIDIYGDEDFIKIKLKQLPEGSKIRTFPIKINKLVEVKESIGIKNAFKVFFENYSKTNNLTQEEYNKILEIIKNNCHTLV